MIRRLSSFAIFCSMAILLTACASKPARFYTLSAMPGAAGTSSALSVDVGPVSVPVLVDRPQIVVKSGPNQVQLDEFNRWASPLQDNIASVVVENLVTMLGTARVALFPQTLATEADYRVAIEVQGLESDPGKLAVLDAVWTVRRTKGSRTDTGRTTVREAVPGNGYDALVAAHSRALGRLSRDIADAVQTLERSGE